MGIKAGLGDVAARVGQSRGFEKTVEYGKYLSTGIDDSNVAINTFAATLKNSLSNLSAYMDNVSTSKSYLDVVRAQGEVMLSELGEMKQLALQAQNASATDRLALQSALQAKQATIAKKLSTAEFGGVNLFTNSTYTNNFIVGNGLNINASIDSATGLALTSTAGLTVGNAAALVGNAASSCTEIDITIRIYGQATLCINIPGVITGGVGDLVALSPGSVAILDFYTGFGTGTTNDTRQSQMIVGSTAGGVGTTAGGNFEFTAINNGVVDFYGSQSLSTFAIDPPTTINNGTFNIRLTAPVTGAVNTIQITGTSGQTAVGAIGTITIGTGAITPGTACTIDTAANAQIAANVIEAASDQIRQMLRKVDNAASALEGVSSTQIGIEEAMGSAVEELTAADITECMSEIVKGQSMVQYTTAVWSGQRQLSELALRTFQQAVS